MYIENVSKQTEYSILNGKKCLRLYKAAVTVVNKVVYATCQIACRCLSVFEDYDHCKHTLQEVTVMDSSARLRYLFDVMMAFVKRQIRNHYGMNIENTLFKTYYETFREELTIFIIYFY